MRETSFTKTSIQIKQTLDTILFSVLQGTIAQSEYQHRFTQSQGWQFLRKGRSLPTVIILIPLSVSTFYDPPLSYEMEAQAVAGNVCFPCINIHFTGHAQTVTNENSTSQTFRRPQNLNRTQTSPLFRPTMLTILLHCCGDTETNPGPMLQNELYVAHSNARSIENKLDLSEAESNNCTIITSSETWLSHSSGKRKEQITHCRLRLEISNLNYDLMKRHLTANPAGICGQPYETAEHFFTLLP